MYVYVCVDCNHLCLYCQSIFCNYYIIVDHILPKAWSTSLTVEDRTIHHVVPHRKLYGLCTIVGF